MPNDQDRYLPAKETKHFLGDISEMSLWRILKDDPSFPRPSMIGRRRYWRLSELDAYMASTRREGVADAV